jgi:hypothetical protein
MQLLLMLDTKDSIRSCLMKRKTFGPGMKNVHHVWAFLFHLFLSFTVSVIVFVVCCFFLLYVFSLFLWSDTHDKTTLQLVSWKLNGTNFKKRGSFIWNCDGRFSLSYFVYFIFMSPFLNYFKLFIRRKKSKQRRWDISFREGNQCLLVMDLFKYFFFILFDFLFYFVALIWQLFLFYYSNISLEFLSFYYITFKV